MTPHLTKFLRRNDLHKALFWWVLSKRDSFQTSSVEQCIDTFYRKHKIDPDKFPRATALSIYQRMHKEYLFEESGHISDQFGNGKTNQKESGPAC